MISIPSKKKGRKTEPIWSLPQENQWKDNDGEGEPTPTSGNKKEEREKTDGGLSDGSEGCSILRRENGGPGGWINTPQKKQ